jgi:Ni,Fe-hydrogenase I cytochrome b subunit
MYTLVLLLHSWVRWFAVITGVIATVMLITTKPAKGEADPVDRWGLFFMIALDLQLLLGMALYLGVSPTSAAILNDFGAAMKDPAARFFAVEHITMMLFAIVMAHLGRILARRATTPAAKRTRLLICLGLATVAMLAGTPWPGMAGGRPLFRLS